jgi:hypothetical protein
MLLQRGLLISNLSGSVGDWTFVPKSRNTGGGLDFIQRRPRPSFKLPPTNFKPLSRLAFRYADTAYTNMPQSERQQWRDAIKAKNTTAYTLFMGEAMASILAFGKPPSVPSASGGFSNRFINYGGAALEKQLDCAELPYFSEANWTRPTITTPIASGDWTCSLQWGAIRYTPPSSPPLRWGQDPQYPGCSISWEPIGRPELAVKLPWLNNAGFPDFRLAGLAFSDQPYYVTIPPGEYGSYLKINKAPGWTFDGYLRVVTGTRPPGSVMV